MSSIKSWFVDARQRYLEFRMKKLFLLNEELKKAQQDLAERNKILEETNLELEQTNARLESQVMVDPVTGQLNQRALRQSITYEIYRTKRTGRVFSLIFLDLDHFKSINDTYGHSCGDQVLIEASQTMQRTLRNVDIVGRWGGEEFLLLLPETNHEQALIGAERVRTGLSNHLFSIGGGIHVTGSMGVATWSEHAQDLDILVQKADAAMYAAKMLGRNLVISASDNRVSQAIVQRSEDRQDVLVYGIADAIILLLAARYPIEHERLKVVGILAESVARELGVENQEASMIRLAGYLYDLGKLAIPDGILRKPTELTEDEWTIIHTKPIIGAEVLDRIPPLRPLVQIIRAHQEKWDGTGYPDGLQGEMIPLGSRILSVVAAYAAMTRDRPFKEKYTPVQALYEIECGKGSQFDPRVVSVFLSVIHQRGIPFQEDNVA
jgi:two-component system cell cycle response regulator